MRSKKSDGGTLLTPLEAKIVKSVASGKKRWEAGMEAGMSTKNSGAVYASKVLSRPHVQEALEAELERQGISIAKAVAPIADALNADKMTMQGDVVKDHASRLKAAGMALSLLGVNTGQPQVNINFNAYAREQKERYQI